MNVVHARVFIPRAAHRFSSLIGCSDDVFERHYVEFGLFGVASDSGYVFYHNLDWVLLLFVFIRLDRKYYLYLYLNCWHNCFYKVLSCSLPSGDLLLQTEYKGTIVRILHNTISFWMEFLVVGLFELHYFSLQVVLRNDCRIPIFFPITAVKWNHG